MVVSLPVWSSHKAVEILESLPYLQRLAIDGATDDQLMLLGRLTRLRRFELSNAHFTPIRSSGWTREAHAFGHALR